MRSVLVIVVGLFIGAIACGPAASNRANVTAGTMPEGGSFTGVYFSPQYGRMDVVQTGSSVVGEYTKDERRGRIEGTVRGDLMRFQWTERRELIRGRPQVTRGLGYFRYVLSGEDHQLVGEWGIDDNETGGGPWTGVKSKRMQPRLSVDVGGRRQDDSMIEHRGTINQTSDSAGGSTQGGTTSSDDL